MTSAKPAPPAIQVIPVPGLPEVRPGDDLAGLIAEAAGLQRLALATDAKAPPTGFHRDLLAASHQLG